MLINEEIKLDYSDVLIRPKRSTMSSRGEVCLSRTHKFLWSTKEWTGIPVMSANMDTVGTPSMHKVLSDHKMITCPARHFLRDGVEKFKDGKNHVCWFGGIDEISHLSTVSSAFIGLDVANGYTIRFVDAVKKLREKCPNATIAAGNVVTADMTQELILAGADIVKVGIGPGSVCTTRKVAGVGYPQLSAISECADAAHGLGGHVMSDGGCTSPGDIAKAFAAGADFVMLGGMLAGHAESGGELIENEDGTKSKIFYGMSSEKAMTTYFGGVAKHRAPEGKEVRVPYKGKIEHTVQSILGGVRSACSYVGARRIKDLPKCTTFVRVTITTNEIYTSHEVS